MERLGNINRIVQSSPGSPTFYTKNLVCLYDKKDEIKTLIGYFVVLSMPILLTIHRITYPFIFHNVTISYCGVLTCYLFLVCLREAIYFWGRFAKNQDCKFSLNPFLLTCLLIWSSFPKGAKRTFKWYEFVCIFCKCTALLTFQYVFDEISANFTSIFVESLLKMYLKI